jgi:hypothetical protein
VTLDGAAGSTYDLFGTSVPTTLNSGGKNSEFILGGDGALDDLAATLTVNGSGASNSVGLDDDASLFQGTYTITAGSVNRPGFGGLTYNSVQSLDLTGTQHGDVFNVLGSSVPMILYGLGNDTFNIGNGDLGSLQGPLTVRDFNGINSVNITDQQAAGGQSYTITSSTVSRPGFGD